MHGVHWSGTFLDAYTYSTNYLLFTLTIIAASIISVWIYEKPQIYKLIIKKSKHSNTISPVQSGNILPDCGNECEHEDLIQQSPEEIAKIDLEL